MNKNTIITAVVIVLAIICFFSYSWFQQTQAKDFLCLEEQKSCAVIPEKQVQAPGSDCIIVYSTQGIPASFVGEFCRPGYRIFKLVDLQNQLKESCATISAGVVSQVDNHTYSCTGPGGTYTNDLLNFTTGWVEASSSNQ